MKKPGATHLAFSMLRFCMRSKLGIILAVTYGLVSVVIFGYAMLCLGMFCGLIILAPIMPWPFLVEMVGFPAFFNNMFGAVVFALINAGLLYWLGSAIERYRSRSITDKV
jgi:hypothetical protein